MSFNYDVVNSTMGNTLNQLDGDLKSFSATMDPNNAADLIKFQQMTQQWSLAVTTQTTSVKLVGDALRGVMQKVG